MVETPAVESAGVGSRYMPVVHELLEEVVRLLAIGNAGEPAILPLHTDASVEHHRREEPCLAFRVAELHDGRLSLSRRGDPDGSLVDIGGEVAGEGRGHRRLLSSGACWSQGVRGKLRRMFAGSGPGTGGLHSESTWRRGGPSRPWGRRR
jgi:hypothetical protein